MTFVSPHPPREADFRQLGQLSRRHQALVLNALEEGRASDELLAAMKICEHLAPVGDTASAIGMTNPQLSEIHVQLLSMLVFLFRWHSGGESGAQAFHDFLRQFPDLGAPLADLVRAPETNAMIDAYLNLIAPSPRVEPNRRVPLTSRAPAPGGGLRVERMHDALREASYFGERCLAAYDSGLRRGRGVYYTPEPVVSYVLRSLLSLLGAGVGGDWGDRQIKFVDPACGHGAFLGPLWRMWRRLDGAPDAAEAAARFSRNCLGLEVLPASCAAANLLLRARWAIDQPGTKTRNIVLCRNSLEDPNSLSAFVRPNGEDAVVVLGNPPYSNFGRGNRHPWILNLLKDYKHEVRERKLNLNDDFIKFIRWGQYWVEWAGAGVVALVTNNTFLAGLTHRGMRASLLRTFDDIYVLDLHGSQKKRERTPRDQADENVFDIQQGVAISIMVKRKSAARAGRVRHYDLWGSRAEKLEQLTQTDLSTTPWKSLAPRAPRFFFTSRYGAAPQRERPAWTLDRIFQVYTSGVQTKNDRLFVDFDRQRLERRMRRLLENPERFLAEHPGDPPAGFRISPKLLEAASRVQFSEDNLRPYASAPFDIRWVYYEPRLLGRARYPVMRHMLAANAGLVFMRQSTNQGLYDHFWASPHLVSDRVFYSAHGAPFLAPLFLNEGESKTPNLRWEFLRDLERSVGISVNRGRDQCETALDVFGYLYALFFCSHYRRQFAPFLQVDFPPAPLTSDRDRFLQLGRLGRELLQTHTALASDSPAGFAASASEATLVAAGYPKTIKREAARGGEQLRVLINRDLSLGECYPPEWAYQIGGYPILPRWLKQRRGQKLTSGQMRQFGQLAEVVRRTLALTDQIDRAALELEFFRATD